MRPNTKCWRVRLAGFAFLCAWGLTYTLPAAADPVTEGRSAYTLYCLKCHGPNMVNSGAQSYDLRKFPADQKQRFVTSVKKGKRSMPAWGDILSDEQIEKDAMGLCDDPRKMTWSAKCQILEHVSQLQARSCWGQVRRLSVRPLRAKTRLLFVWKKTARHFPISSNPAGADSIWLLPRPSPRDLAARSPCNGNEAEDDDENSPVLEVNALLSAGKCDLVGGYPLFGAALSDPQFRTWPLPDHDGMKRSQRGRQFELGKLATSRPYFRTSFAVILGPKSKRKSVQNTV